MNYCSLILLLPLAIAIVAVATVVETMLFATSTPQLVPQLFQSRAHRPISMQTSTDSSVLIRDIHFFPANCSLLLNFLLALCLLYLFFYFLENMINLVK